MVSFGNRRRLDIMGVGQQGTIHIPPCQEMQGVYGSAVVGSGGQHTEPVETVDEFSDGLAVAAHVLRQFHIGSCRLSHLQDNLNALDTEDGLCPHGCGHQPVQALLPVDGGSAAQNKIPLLVRKDGAIVYLLFTFIHNL